jgi:hypothetical protein
MSGCTLVSRKTVTQTMEQVNKKYRNLLNKYQSIRRGPCKSSQYVDFAAFMCLSEDGSSFQKPVSLNDDLRVEVLYPFSLNKYGTAIAYLSSI